MKIIVNVISRDLKDNKKKDQIEYCFDWCEGDKVSSAVHSAFNYISGDVYAWPADNISPEQVDEQFKLGQRIFVIFINGYQENLVRAYLIEENKYNEENKKRYKQYKKEQLDAKKVELLDEHLKCELTWRNLNVENPITIDDYRYELDSIREEIKKHDK